MNYGLASFFLGLWVIGQLFRIVIMWTKSAPWSFTTTLVWLSISCKRVSKIYSGFGTGFSRMSEGASSYSLHLRAIFWQTNIYIQIFCEWGSQKPIQYLISDSKRINEINFDDAVMPNETKFLSQNSKLFFWYYVKLAEIGSDQSKG